MTGEKIRSEEKGKKQKEWEGIYTFSNYEYDAKGNWISRDVKLKITDLPDGKTEETAYKGNKEDNILERINGIWQYVIRTETELVLLLIRLCILLYLNWRC